MGFVSSMTSCLKQVDLMIYRAQEPRAEAAAQRQSSKPERYVLLAHIHILLAHIHIFYHTRYVFVVRMHTIHLFSY